tara:strand:- start:539 stop:1228 length:690 start_codon:yes stop_codon:yes gene_type:complete
MTHNYLHGGSSNEFTIAPEVIETGNNGPSTELTYITSNAPWTNYLVYSPGFGLSVSPTSGQYTAQEYADNHPTEEVTLTLSYNPYIEPRISYALFRQDGSENMPTVVVQVNQMGANQVHGLEVRDADNNITLTLNDKITKQLFKETAITGDWPGGGVYKDIRVYDGEANLGGANKNSVVIPSAEMVGAPQALFTTAAVETAGDHLFRLNADDVGDWGNVTYSILVFKYK